MQQLSSSRDKAHGQAVLILHRLLGEVVRLPDAFECAALARTHGVAGEDSDQDGLHHHHGDVFAHAGSRPAAEGLEETAGHLRNGRRKASPFVCLGLEIISLHNLLFSQSLSS